MKTRPTVKLFTDPSYIYNFVLRRVASIRLRLSTKYHHTLPGCVRPPLVEKGSQLSRYHEVSSANDYLKEYTPEKDTAF